MKKFLFEKPHKPFLLLALLIALIATLYKGADPESFFDISVYKWDFHISFSRIWSVFSGYLFFLAGIYFMISKTKLKVVRLFVILHFVCILLFLVFFIFFASFANEGVKQLMQGVPLSSLLTVYATIFVLDLTFFIVGILFLFINLFALNKND